jgi:hypothetical protein
LALPKIFIPAPAITNTKVNGRNFSISPPARAKKVRTRAFAERWIRHPCADHHGAQSEAQKGVKSESARSEVEIFEKMLRRGASSHENVYDFRMRYSTGAFVYKRRKNASQNAGKGSDAGGIFAADAHLAQGGGMKFEAVEGTLLCWLSLIDGFSRT